MEYGMNGIWNPMRPFKIDIKLLFINHINHINHIYQYNTFRNNDRQCGIDNGRGLGVPTSLP